MYLRYYYRLILNSCILCNAMFIFWSFFKAYEFAITGDIAIIRMLGIIAISFIVLLAMLALKTKVFND